MTIDAETNELNMEVGAEEIAARLSRWTAPRLAVNRGALAKYVHLVADASRGVSFIFPSVVVIVAVVVVVVVAVWGDLFCAWPSQPDKSAGRQRRNTTGGIWLIGC